MASLLKNNTNTINDLLTTINNLPNAITIDTTLTQSGQAADAKIVGDALAEKQPIGDYALKSDIPTVPAWAMASTKPTYTASEVGADARGTASSAVSIHNTATNAHNDIRLLVEGLATRLNTLADSDDTTLDQMSEIVAYIKSNKSLIEDITTNKVNVSDIINNLTTNVTNKPLSAAQGVALKELIDAITVPSKLSDLTDDTTHRLVTDAEKNTWNAKSNFSGNYNDLTNKPTIPTVPTNVSAFTNDKGYLTSYTETDPTVPAWAKASTKPSYTKSEVGLSNVDNVKQYSASNPPPYPVTSVNGKTGAVTLNAADVGARPSTWTPTAANVGAVPTSRTVNGKALSSNITLSASDVSASPINHASTSTTYGVGTTEQYGHVKIVDIGFEKNANGDYVDSDGNVIGMNDTHGYVPSMWHTLITEELLSLTDQELLEKINDKANTTHNQAASTITAGTFAGRVQGNATAMATLGNTQFRNIYAGTSDLTAGTSSLTTGTLYFVYE